MKTKKSKKGIILFLCLYVVMVAVAVGVIFYMISPLRQQLADYEAAQLENQCSQIFRSLFAEPDWEKLYDLSGTEDTAFEGADSYAAYMKAKVGDEELTYKETYCETAGVHRYDVLLGEETIAAFAVTDTAGSESDLPQWERKDVEVFFTRSVSVTVEKKPEYTVYINDVALDDSFTIRTVSTNAESYLPEGVHGYRLEQQYVSGLLVQPRVRVVDEKGEAVAMNCENGVYTLPDAAVAEMTDEEKAVARNAAVADTKFSMRRISAAELGKYFDTNSQVYADIVNNPLFIQSHKGFAIDESAIEIGEFCRYSEDHFSAKVKLNVNITRKDGTLKIYGLDKTYFFARNESGDYLVREYTNESVRQVTEQVRLTFVMGDGETRAIMTDSGADVVNVPQITSDQLIGWATETDDGNGTVTQTVRILPDGTVLGELEPMTLYPVFQSE